MQEFATPGIDFGFRPPPPPVAAAVRILDSPDMVPAGQGRGLQILASYACQRVCNLELI